MLGVSKIEKNTDKVSGLRENIFGLLFSISLYNNASDNGVIYFYQHIYAINFIKKSIVAYLFAEDDVFVGHKQDALSIFKKIDFIFDNDFFVVLNNSVFEKYFGYDEKIKKDALEKLDEIYALEKM